MVALTGTDCTLSAPRQREIVHNLGHMLLLGHFMFETYLASLDKTVASERVLPKPLSTRELECLQLIARGYNSKQIAKALNIGFRTVHYYVGNALAKLESANRQEAVARALALGFLRIE